MQEIKDRADVKVFQCPNCQNYINNMLSKCKYCSVELNQALMASAIGNEELINDAYNAGNNIKNYAAALAGTFAMSFIPFLGIIAALGHYILLITIPFSILYFLFKYGRFASQDKNYKEAKKFCWIGLGVWLAFFVLRIVLFALFLPGRRY